MSEWGRVSEGPGGFNRFGSNRYLGGAKDFLESNSIIAKFAFLILVLIIFVTILRLGTMVMSYIFSPSPNPVLIDGMVEANELLVIPQDPKVKGSIPIMRSSNENDGIEFTWSTWLFIKDLGNSNQHQHVFHKGNDDVDHSTGEATSGFVKPNNAPGLYIENNTNNLIIKMSTFTNYTDIITIDNIPLKKWLNVIIRCDGNKLDIYINGILTRRHILESVPKQNYGDVYVAMNGGFSGYISELRYYNSALGTSAIQSIVDAGPNLKVKGGGVNEGRPHYLSTRWFFSGLE